MGMDRSVQSTGGPSICRGVMARSNAGIQVMTRACEDIPLGTPDNTSPSHPASISESGSSPIGLDTHLLLLEGRALNESLALVAGLADAVNGVHVLRL